MVLGESHYCDEECVDCGNRCRHRECMNFTQNVLQTYLDKDSEYENWMNTFRKFERSLVGHETAREESKKIWNSVVLYNYLLSCPHVSYENIVVLKLITIWATRVKFYCWLVAL